MVAARLARDVTIVPFDPAVVETAARSLDRDAIKNGEDPFAATPPV
jgi:hypothetical protein